MSGMVSVTFMNLIPPKLMSVTRSVQSIFAPLLSSHVIAKAGGAEAVGGTKILLHKQHYNSSSNFNFNL
eukprot:5056439-Amphidinium_carterae.2